jgi:hypothetical protein
VKSETLAQRLGTTPHLSPLLMKAKRLGLSAPEDLERLAVRRGLRYYGGPEDGRVMEGSAYSARCAVSEADLSNEELAMALLALALPFSQFRLRMGAAMLSARGTSPIVLGTLALQERNESVIKHIATCGQQVEPENLFWRELLDKVASAKVYPPDVLPHITRFVAMTGVTRRGKETVMQWIRPHWPIVT